MAEPEAYDGPDVMAGEYVLRVLEGSELAEARRRMLADPGFVAQVNWWEDRFGTLCEQSATIEPGAAVWPAILARLESDTASAVVPMRRGPAGWSIAFALGGLGAAAAAIALFVTTPTTIRVPVPGPTQVASAEGQLVAQLASEDAAIRLATIVDPASRRLSLSASGLRPEQGQASELWVIPEGGAPVSLGLIPGDGKLTRELTVEEAGLMRAGATFAVTYETADGAPHAAPTLPIVVAGGLGEV